MENPEIVRPFNIEEIYTAISSIKHSKAAGLDGLYPEFLHFIGKRIRLWILKLLNQIFKTSRLPPLMKKTIIIAILKPNKDPDNPESYRPIALLSIMYKLLEKLIYLRTKAPIDEVLPPEFAGF